MAGNISTYVSDIVAGMLCITFSLVFYYQQSKACIELESSKLKNNLHQFHIFLAYIYNREQLSCSMSCLGTHKVLILHVDMDFLCKEKGLQ